MDNCCFDAVVLPNGADSERRCAASVGDEKKLKLSVEKRHERSTDRGPAEDTARF